MTPANEPPTGDLHPGIWVAVREHVSTPLSLLMAGGGSAAEAVRITTELSASVERVIGSAPVVTWSAVRWGASRMSRTEWDPTTPIPEGTEALLCRAWLRRGE